MQHEYHLLILDEAQCVKNAATRAAATIRALRARHRLCLSGTPWRITCANCGHSSISCPPGFWAHETISRGAGAPRTKRRRTVRRELLARRLRPFTLRRRKDEVATELPPKTTIVRTVERGYPDLRASLPKKTYLCETWRNSTS